MGHALPRPRPDTRSHPGTRHRAQGRAPVRWPQRHASPGLVVVQGSRIVAVGANCCPPAALTRVLDRMPPTTPGVVYPNSGEVWDAASRSWHGDATATFADVDAWVEAGSRLIGGCCRTTPEDIAGLARRLKD